MTKYELSLSENYVSSWGLVEAVREIFQNALDQEIQYSDNKMFYEFGANHLSIGNKASRLNIESLLLGESSKKDDESTIGKFGEGYKLALLVLTRLGKKVKIYNYQAREVWEAKLRPSKKYNGVRTLIIEVQDKYIWQRVPNNDLTYVIDGITFEEKQDIIRSNLRLQERGEELKTRYGQILCDPEQKGRIYVNGLFVSTVDEMRYGYNFKPEHIELDRDRRMIAHFDLTWRTSEMWKQSGDRRLVELTMTKADDVKYFSASYSYSNSSSDLSALADMAYDQFMEKNGPKAHPVVNQKDMEQLLQRHGNLNNVRPVVVHDTHYALLNTSTKFRKVQEELPPITEIAPPMELMYSFYDAVRDKLDGPDLLNLWNLVLMSTKWKVGG